MTRRDGVICTVKWIGTLICLLIAIAFVVTIGRVVEWRTTDLRYGTGVGCGAWNISWRPPEWTREADCFAGWAGWMVAKYEGSLGVDWWVHFDAGPKWRWVEVPLWMPFAAVGLPTAALWYRNRAGTRQATRSFLVRLCPRRRQRVTLGLVAIFCVVHLAALFAASSTLASVSAFFNGPAMAASVNRPLERIGPVFFFGTPVWAFGWAWLCVRFRNGLWRTRHGSRCYECGYDLTGNVSGRCPECGAPA